MALLRTIVEDPCGGNHLGGLDAAFDDESDLIDGAWAEAQLAADTTWLGLGIGVRVALVPKAGRFQVVLVEIRGRRQTRGWRRQSQPARGAPTSPSSAGVRRRARARRRGRSGPAAARRGAHRQR